MKSILKTTLLGAALALALSSPAMAAGARSVSDVREETARQVATMINDPLFDSALREHMSKGKVTLSDALQEYAQDATLNARSSTTDALHDLDREAIRLRGLDGRIGSLLGLRLHGVDAKAPPTSLRDFWTATVNRDPSTGQPQLIAYDPKGHEHRYSADALPDVPMLVVESDNDAAMQAGIALVNEALRAGGLQAPTEFNPSPRVAQDPNELTLLKKIRLADDKEPNILFGAEIYAVVSGITADGKPQLVVHDMPWLDHDKTWYTPNQDLINWTNYGANYVSVQFFEADDYESIDFKALAVTLLGALGDVSLVVSPAAPTAVLIAGISQIAKNIADSIPKAAYENKEDYVDSFYVIERGGNYGTDAKPLMGAANNAQIVLEPYVVK